MPSRSTCDSPRKIPSWRCCRLGATVKAGDASASCWDRIVEGGTKNTPKRHPFHYPVWQFFAPDFTRFCPRDPRAGPDAAQWFGRHFIERIKKCFPRGDGYALDVTICVFWPNREAVGNADLDDNDQADRGFMDGVNWRGVGMNDFVHYTRNGVSDKFTGLGNQLPPTWDATDNGEQRFFHLLNGAEFEHGVFPAGRSAQMLSSHLDRLLLRAERAQKPNVTSVSNKRPDEAYPGGTLAELRKRPKDSLRHWRPAIMAAACMASGFLNKKTGRGNADLIEYPGREEQRKRYGQPLPQD